MPKKDLVTKADPPLVPFNAIPHEYRVLIESMILIAAKNGDLSESDVAWAERKGNQTLILWIYSDYRDSPQDISTFRVSRKIHEYARSSND